MKVTASMNNEKLAEFYEFSKEEFLRLGQANLAAYLIHKQIMLGSTYKLSRTRLRMLVKEWCGVIAESDSLHVFDTATVLISHGSEKEALTLVRAWLRSQSKEPSLRPLVGLAEFWLLQLYLELKLGASPRTVTRTSSKLTELIKPPILRLDWVIATLKQLEHKPQIDGYAQYVLARRLWGRLLEARSIFGAANEDLDRMCSEIVTSHLRSFGIGFEPVLLPGAGAGPESSPSDSPPARPRGQDAQ